MSLCICIYKYKPQSQFVPVIFLQENGRTIMFCIATYFSYFAECSIRIYDWFIGNAKNLREAINQPYTHHIRKMPECLGYILGIRSMGCCISISVPPRTQVMCASVHLHCLLCLSTIGKKYSGCFSSPLHHTCASCVDQY